ncbi:hypothetical protein [Caulobacter sp. NIBR2454]|uniref:hypothetical protein n=1 Tax=Caulobacter sp. NIBR2454 TaxID=3015996 RepID=UPI0022B66096|nr:hypothetical protein [Caulobacter sp. NIBR2454]
MEQRVSDLDAARVDPHAPLLIVDVDEVIAHFVGGFSAFLNRHGFELRTDRYALFQNIFRPGETDHLDMAIGYQLYNDFFSEGSDDLPPVEGAADALATLSMKAGVVILTNAPECGRHPRAAWLKKHGFDYPMVIGSGPKGEPAAALAARTTGRSAFIDDLLSNLDSVEQVAPAISRFQIVAHPELRHLAPTAPDRHARFHEWTELHPALEKALWPA